jgi:hypothetical protein
MKNRKHLAFLLLVCTSLFFINCTPSKQEYLSSTKEIISTGKWTVNYFYSGQNQTSSLSNYKFSFQNNGIVICNLDSTDVSGSWSIIHDLNNNDVLVININSQQTTLMQLNASWNVTDKSTSEVGMKNANSAELQIRKM